MSKTFPFEVSSDLSPEDVLELQNGLSKEKQGVEKRAVNEFPPGLDLHASNNTLIPKSEWYPIYEPFAERLTDLKKHLRGPQRLPYPCMVELIDDKTPPFVSPSNSIHHPDQKGALEDNIKKYLDMGIVEYGPASWKTALFVVPQKVNDEQRNLPNYLPSQQWRVVQNFIPLNAGIKKEENTLLLIPNIFQIASGKEILSLLDFSKAFFHCRVREQDRTFFGISHPNKQLRMHCMPKGFANSPSIWQRNMNDAIWKPVQELFYQKFPSERDQQHLAIHMDDIFVATKTKTHHLYLLKLLFRHLTHYHLTLSIDKSFIGKRSVYLLGEVISPHKRTVQPERIHALTMLAPPQTVFQVRSMLGALRNLSEHIPLLNQQLHSFDSYTGNVPATKAPYVLIHWTPQLFETFQKIKQLIYQPSCLFHFDPSLPLYLETDASNTGCGPILFQKARGEVQPLAYSSQAWKTNMERVGHTCRKEMDALKRTVLKYDYLLKIYPFTIITDNMGVFHLLRNFAQGKSRKVVVTLHYLQTKMLHPVEKIIHKATNEVFMSDALSRMAWHQLAIEEDDPTAWPALFVNPSLVDAISRQVTRHLRHQKCQHAKQGKHPVSKCVRPYCQGLSKEQFQILLRDLKEEPRLSMVSGWIMAKYGHTRDGSTLPPDTYDGPNLTLFHATTLDRLPSIKVMGLSPMNRWYIHFTSVGPHSYTILIITRKPSLEAFLLFSWWTLDFYCPII